MLLLGAASEKHPGERGQAPPRAMPWDVQVTTTRLAKRGSGPAVRIQRAFGGAGNDTSYDLWPAGSDGGWLIVGSTQDPSSGDVDVAVLSLSSTGDVVWSNRYGGPGLDIGFGVRTLPSGDIVVAGWTNRIGAGEGDFLLLGLRPDGALAFERAYGTAFEERAVSLVVTEGGNVAVVGESYDEGGSSRFYLVVTDFEGNLLWERTYDGGHLNERGLAILELEDGFLLAGNSMDSRSGSTASASDGYAVRTDLSGEVLWRRSYGGPEHDIFHHVTPLGPDEFLFTGYTRGFGAEGRNDVWLVRTDGNGEVLGQRLQGGPGADHNILARPSGADRVALAGYSTRTADGLWDAQVMELGLDGEVIWSEDYGGEGEDGAVALYPVGSGGLAIAGFTTSEGGGGRDILFMELESPGPSDDTGDDSSVR